MSERSESKRPSVLRDNWRHLNGPRRVAGIDLARGIALIGMVAAHVTWVDGEVVWADPATWAGLVHGNSSILFATLAGVSVGIVTGGSDPLTGDALGVKRRRLLVRAGLLWIIGLLLMATTVPVIVILPAYAILFAIAAALVSLRASALFLLAAVVAVTMPFVHAWAMAAPVWRFFEMQQLALLFGLNYPFLVWTAFVVAGLGLARAGVTRLRVQVVTLVAGAALAAGAFALDADGGVRSPRVGDPLTSPLSYLERVWSGAPHSSGVLEVVGSGGLALAVIAACALLCRPWRRSAGGGAGPVAYALLPIRAVGAMPLSAYTGHLLAWFVVAAVTLPRISDLAGFREMDPFWPMTIGIVVACTLWALLVGRGPLEAGVEWLCRRLVPSGPRHTVDAPR